MRVCGVICEFDPFHNGHAALLRRLKEENMCDALICVMSGSFTQRGEPAFLPKWTRAEMALRAGADAVFELPALFAVRDAAGFARGGVGILKGLGVVTHLGFGSESGDAEALLEKASRAEDSDAFRQALNTGEAPGVIRSRLLGLDSSAPNDVLAVEYLRKAGGTLEPIAVHRIGTGHADEQLNEYASGTAVRRAVREGKDVSVAVPFPEVITTAAAKGELSETDRFDLMLLTALRMGTDFSAAAEAAEGLERLLLRAAETATDREKLLALAKTRRYTRARLSRVLAQGMLGITHELAEKYPEPPYARLLGFRQKAAPLMKEIRARAVLPVIQRPAVYHGEGQELLAIEAKATDLRALSCGKDRDAGRDWRTTVRIV